MAEWVDGWVGGNIGRWILLWIDGEWMEGWIKLVWICFLSILLLTPKTRKLKHYHISSFKFSTGTSWGQVLLELS